MLRCSMKTAWFLGHRIREAMRERHGIFTPPLGGEGVTLEADEAFLQRNPGKKLGGPGPQKVVFALVEREGRVRSFHVPNVRINNLHPLLAQHADRRSHLMTDESQIYRGIGWNFASHQTVTHRDAEYVRGDVSTNSVEGYFSILKRGVYGVFHHVSEEHFGRYLCEFDFRHNTRAKLGVDDCQRADIALMGVVGKRLTYETTGGKGTAKATVN
jgi:transposase-like protein